MQDILDEEKQFYESEKFDKLKVTPFTKVTRVPRDYTNEQKIQDAYNSKITTPDTVRENDNSVISIRTS